MENLSRCFFCCKNISQENSSEERNSFKDPFDSFNYGEPSTKIKDSMKSMKAHVLQISHYLKVPKPIIDQDDDDDGEVSSVITTCVECTEISGKLSDLCGQLETINLKISHYFNLLADQILEIPVEEDDDGEDGQIQMSDFQKLVHEKCLFKVQQDNSDSQIDPETSPNSPVQIEVEDSTNQSIILEESEDEIKPEIKIEEEEPLIEIPPPTDELNHELHSCPFCDYLVQGPYDLLHSHISAQHPEHFETEEPEEPSYDPIPTCDLCGTFVSAKVLARHKHLFCPNRVILEDPTPEALPKIPKKKTNKRMKCYKCGKGFSSRRDLKRHITSTKTCATAGQNTGAIEEIHSCPFCDFSVGGSSNLLHDHITDQHPDHFQNEEFEDPKPGSSSSKSAEHSNKVMCQLCNKSLANIWNIRRHMITVHPGSTGNGNMAAYSNFKNPASRNSTNKPIKNPLFCRARKNSPTEKKNTEVNEFKCNKCGKNFACRGNLRRHLREIASCAAEEGNSNDKNERFECSKCNKQYNRLDYIKMHIEDECKAGLLIDHDTGTKLTLEEVSKKISKCEFCGLNVYSKNLRKHVSLKHSGGGEGKRKEEICEICKRSCGNIGNLRVHMLAAHGVDMEGKMEGRKIFRCGGCGRKYNSRRSWRRHLRSWRHEKCRLAGNNLQVEGFGDGEREICGGEKEEEEETEVMLSIPEGDTGDYSLLMMMEDEQVPSEDPLQI